MLIGSGILILAVGDIIILWHKNFNLKVIDYMTSINSMPSISYIKFI